MLFYVSTPVSFQNFTLPRFGHWSGICVRGGFDLTGISLPFYLVRNNINDNRQESDIPRKSFTAEQIIANLHQIEVVIGQGQSIAGASQEVGILEQSYYRSNSDSVPIS